MMSDITVCNLALAHLGCASIASLDESSEAARQCRVHYQPALDAALAAYDWPFSIRYQSLAEKTSCPPGWRHAYQAPADCLRIVEIMDKTGRQVPPAPYTMGFGGVILTDVADAWARYIARVDDPGRWPAPFLQMMTWRLAADMAMPLTGDRSRFSDTTQIYDRCLTEARAAALNEGQPQEQPDAVWIAARQ